MINYSRYIVINRPEDNRVKNEDLIISCLEWLQKGKKLFCDLNYNVKKCNCEFYNRWVQHGVILLYYVKKKLIYQLIYNYGPD